MPQKRSTPLHAAHAAKPSPAHSGIASRILCTFSIVAAALLSALGCFMASGDEYAASLTASILENEAEQKTVLPLTGNAKSHAVVPGASSLPLVNAASDNRRSYCYRGMTMTFQNAELPYAKKEYLYKLESLPKEISETLAERGWKIVVTGKDISDMFPIEKMPSDVDEPTGICWIPEKRIYVNKDSLPSVVTHEIAHAIDWESGGASLRADWAQALEADTVAARNKPQTLFTKQHSGNVTEKIYSRGWFFEYWAEAFETYWNNPKALVQQYPRCYDYFEKRYGPVLAEDEKQQAISEGQELDVDDIKMKKPKSMTVEEKIKAMAAADELLRITRALSA